MRIQPVACGFIFILICLIPGNLVADNQQSPNILILNSYHPGYKWSDDIMEGIRTVVAGRYPKAVYYIEYMDTKRIPLGQSRGPLQALYRSKYSDVALDVIICTDNNAFDFLRQYRDELFPDVPVVFCGINFLRPNDVEGLIGYTGVNEEADLLAGLSLALTLHPERKRIHIINDRTTTGLRVRAELEKVVRSLPQDIDFVYWDDLEMADLIEKVRRLNSGDLLFYTFFFRDKSGKFFEYDTSARLVAGISPVPVYGAWDFSLGYGIIGGMLTSGYFQGKTAAEQALKIMGGTPVSQILPVWQSPNRYMFDYQMLKKFNVSIDQLPPERIIINQPASIYARHKTMIWVAALVLLMVNLFIFVVILNIVKRRRLEEKIIKSQKRLKSILETANEGFWEVDRYGVIVDVNPEMCHIFSRSREKIVGRAIGDLVDLQTAKHIQHYIDLGLAGRQTNFELRLTRSDGTVAECLCSLTPRFNADGSLKGAFAMVADISDIKAVQADLKQSQATLHATFNSTGDGLIVVNETGVITHLNKQLALIWGFPYTLWGLKSDRQLLRLLMEMVESPDEFAYQIRQVSQTSVKVLETIRFKDGRFIECFSTPLMVETIQKGRVWSFRDVTEKKNLENQLIQAQKMEAIGNLAGGIAHDFNNRLQAVSGYTQLLLLDKDRDDSDSQKLLAIQDAAQKSCELTRQLLTFSRRVESRLEPTDLNYEVRLITDLLTHTIASTVYIRMELDDGILPIHADPGQIEQVITNLGINAWHAMSQGGELTIKTQNIHLDKAYCSVHLGVTPGKYVRLQVSDTGHGMDRKTMARIFEPFFSTKSDKEGSGLGLAMVHGIIKNHGGQITCNSAPNAGTTFTIHFPAIDLDFLPVDIKGPVLKELPSGNETILLIDDEVEILDIGRLYLQEFGYKVECTTSAQKAVRSYEQSPEKYDLIILDIKMPGMDGHQALKAFKQIDPFIKVMIASGYASKGEINSVLSEGAKGFVSKPYQMADLISKVRSILDD